MACDPCTNHQASLYCQFQGICLFSVIKYQSITYEGKEYPIWAEVLGWSIACCSMLCIPVTAVRMLLKAEGSFFEVSDNVCRRAFEMKIETTSCLSHTQE